MNTQFAVMKRQLNSIEIIRKYVAVIRMTWIQSLEYKANIVVGTFAILSGVIIEYLLWKRIFITRGISEIGGFTFNALIIYIFYCLVVGQLKSSWVTSIEMIDGIREGELNKYLIRPISYFVYHLMLFIGHNSLYYFVYFILITGTVIFLPEWVFPTISHGIFFVLTLFVSVYLSYTMYFLMVCFAFWFGEVRSLVIAYNLANLVLSGQMVPMQLFPEGLRAALHFTPLPYLVDIPVSIATGRLPAEQWVSAVGIGIFWTILMTFAGKWLYSRGIKRYEGFGG
ncbi:MAG: ABC transporter permease [Fidelibacterota bacterium]